MEEVYIIYGITDCPACLHAQAVLMEAEKEYVFIDMDFSQAYRASIKTELKWETLPIVVKLSEGGGTVIGGFRELADDLAEVTDVELWGGLCPL